MISLSSTCPMSNCRSSWETRKPLPSFRCVSRKESRTAVQPLVLTDSSNKLEVWELVDSARNATPSSRRVLRKCCLPLSLVLEKSTQLSSSKLSLISPGSSSKLVKSSSRLQHLMFSRFRFYAKTQNITVNATNSCQLLCTCECILSS